jgi:Tfp pilus assembly protein PilE
MNKKGFTLVGIMMILGIIALLVALATNLFSVKKTENTAAAKANIRALSKAAETYAISHNGLYPADIAAIATYNAQATVLCASSAASPAQGYVYNCAGLSATGYILTATPVSATAGDATFSVTSGGAITETPYVAPIM